MSGIQDTMFYPLLVANESRAAQLLNDVPLRLMLCKVTSGHATS